MLPNEDELEISEILRIIEETKDLTKLASYFELIARKIERKIDATLDLSNLAEKISKGDDLGEIGYILQMLNTVSKGAAEKVARHLNLETLSEQIERELKIGSMSYWFRRITEISNWLGDELLRRIDLEKIAENIKITDNIFGINFTLEQIIKTDQERAARLLTHIGADPLARKSNASLSSTGLWALRSLLNTVRQVNVTIAEQIVEKLDQKVIARKIEEEATLSEMFFSLENLTSGKEDLQKDLLQNINLNKIVEKIGKSQDIWEITHLLEKISKIDPEKGQRLVRKIDITSLGEKLIQTNVSTLNSYARTLVELLGENKSKQLMSIIKTKIDEGRR